MPCNNCHQPYAYCTCSSSCTPLVNATTLTLDAAKVIYHKSNGEISELTNLDLSNGATLELALETIDAKLEPITSILSTTLTYLRTKYTVNTLTQFLVAVSTELGVLNTAVLAGNTWTTAARPSSPDEGEDGYNLTLHQREYWDGSSWLQY